VGRGGRPSVPVQTGPEAHKASCPVGTGSFPEVKRPGQDVDQSPPSSAGVMNVEKYLFSALCHHGMLEGKLYLKNEYRVSSAL